MLTAAKEGTFSAPSDPCVLFPLAASGVYPKTRVWGSREKTLHCFSATAELRIELRRGCENSSGKTEAGSALDSNGNTQTRVVGSNTTTYAWDFENRMSSVTLPGSGGTVSFKYDPFGRRIYKSSSTATSIYAYDGDNLIEETNSSGGVVARYAQTQNIDEPLAMLRSAATSYFHADGLGSVTSLSNAAGSIANTYTYDSFGKLTASTGSLVNPFQYTARESDTETGLYYYRARYYDLSVGRFLSEDPITFGGGNNFYGFVNNRPIGLSDPMGLSPADVQRIQALCKKCTQDMVDQGRRLPGEGQWSARKTDLAVALGMAKALLRYWGGDVRNWGKLQGCKSQAGQANDCLANDPALKNWTFSEIPWWGGSHTVVLGQSSDPKDPFVYCDPWRNFTWTGSPIPPPLPLGPPM
jgi:RHS repeat-associated protein